MHRLQDRQVVVTGASSGIGLAVARAFASAGATVWMGARRVEALQRAARDIEKAAAEAGGAAHAMALDVRDPDSVDAFAHRISDEAPGVDVLVNNAGVGAWGRAEDTTLETWMRVMETNLTGPFLVTKAMLPLMRRREGRRAILNVVSVAGKTAYAGGGTYSASKFGLRGWTEALALELAEEGIRVTAVNPGYVATPLVSGSENEQDMVQADELARMMVDLVLVPESIHLDDVTVWPWKMYTQ